MRHIPRTPRLAAAFVLIVIAAGATAQSMSDASKATCQIIGANAREPVGDRDGHYLTVVQYSCRNDGGPADGTITPGTVLWVSDKMASALVAGTGVLRKNPVVEHGRRQDHRIQRCREGNVHHGDWQHVHARRKIVQLNFSEHQSDTVRNRHEHELVS